MTQVKKKITEYVTKRKAIGAGALVGALIIGESFVGSINWKQVLNLNEANPIRVAAKSIGVGYRDTKDGYTSRCNYWSVGKRMVMANGHCIDATNKDTTGITVHFTDKKEPVVCEKMLAYSPWEAFDYLLLECNDDIPAPLDLEVKVFEVGEMLVHVSHNCDYYGNSQCKVVAMYDDGPDCKVDSTDYRGGLDITQGCDSLGGSSGSPILSRTPNKYGRLPAIALHHAGHFFPDARGSKEGKGNFNASVKLGFVLNDLKGKGFDLQKKSEETQTKSEDSDNGWVLFFEAIYKFVKEYFSK